MVDNPHFLLAFRIDLESDSAGTKIEQKSLHRKAQAQFKPAA